MADQDRDSESDDGREHVRMPPLPLCQHIKSILKRYPDGGQILKELLQNASDAQATRVQFLLNSRQYGTDSLIHRNMAALQGAALYAYNDGVFAQCDWTAICQVGNSSKKSNAMKVGRFGIGFNSIYHLTDVPCVISDGHVGFFDPMLCHHTEDDGDDASEVARFPVKKFAARYADQCASLNVLEHVVRPQQERFDGTLFRFPLRPKAAPRQRGDGDDGDDGDGDDSAKVLSTTSYAEEDVERKLFASFGLEAGIVLLFLSNVRCVEIHRQLANGTAHRLLQVLSVCEENAEEDDDFSKRLCHASQSSSEQSTVEAVVRMSVDSPAKGRRVQPWLVRHTVGSDDAVIWKPFSKFKLHTWVGIAAAVGADDSWNTSWTSCSNPVSGQAFCFLPLPIETGLPVHVHGYFAITDNRRAIKWPRPDDASTASEPQWNQQLVRLCLGPAYVATLKRLARACQFSRPPQPAGEAEPAPRVCRAYYAWPDARKVQASMASPWSYLVQCMVPLLFTESLLWSWADGGKWLSVEQAWIMEAKAADAVEPAAMETAGHRALSVQAATRIYAFLCALNEPVVLLPAHVLRTLRSSPDTELQSLLAARTIGPETLRCIVRRLQSAGGESRQFLRQHKSAARDVLRLAVADLTGDSPRRLSAVSDLAVFPVLGTSGVRALRGSAVYIPQSSELVDILPGLEDQMLDTVSDAGVGGDTRRILEQLAQLSGEASPLQLLSDQQVPSLLQQSIASWSPGFQRGVESVEWKPGAEHPAEDWLRKVWVWCGKIASLDVLAGLPLIPAQHAADPAHQRLYALRRDPTLLFAADMKEAVKQLLVQAGCVVITVRPGYLSHDSLPDYALTGKQSDVLAALQSVVKRSGIGEVNRRLAALPSVARKELVAFLAASVGGDDGEAAGRYADFTELLRHLQVFTCHQTDSAVTLSGETRYCLLPRSLPEKVLRLRYPPHYLQPAACGDEVSFMARLGCAEAGRSDLLLSHLLPAISQPADAGAQEATAAILKFTVDMILQDNDGDEQLLEKLRTVAFVPRSTPSPAGAAATPTDLVDPDNSLALLFAASDGRFPATPAGVQRERWLLALRRVGLKREKDLTEAIVVERVASVSQLMNGKVENRPAVVERVKRLLEIILRMEAPGSCARYLGEHGACLLAWQRPGGEEYPAALPWCGADPTALYTGRQLLALSRGVRPHLLVGSSACLLDPELMAAIGDDEKTLTSFALRSSSPPASSLHAHVVAHLQLMITTFHSLTQEQRVPLRGYYDSSTAAVYSYLAELQEKQPGECKAALQAHMEAVDWVWLPAGQEFVSPHNIVESLPVDIPSLAPFWHALDGEHRRRQFPLFLAFGARKSLDGRDLRGVLRGIRAGLSAGDRLSDSRLQLALDILRSGTMAAESGAMAGGVLLPTAQRLLVEAELCTFRDTPFPAPEHELGARFNVLHSLVADKLAAQYGAAPLSLKLLPSRSLHCQAAGKPDNGILQHLVETWSDSQVFHEMIQNADDAGATVVKFRLDCRGCEQGGERLLSPEMQRWQGPALWVYNNALVTQEDLQSMTTLGQSSKRGKPGLIGRRGIGLSSVYHLTDVPSFVSGRKVVFFDPHGHNLARRSSKQTPAVVIDFVQQQEGVQAFTDQFSPYNSIFGCQVTPADDRAPVEEYGGTLFRLPLRTALGKSPLHTLQTSLRDLAGRADRLLLFLNHVRELVVEVVREAGEQSTLCHVRVVQDRLVCGDPRADTLLSDAVARPARLKGTHGSEPLSTVYVADVREVSDSGDSRSLKKWIVAGTFGGPESVECARRLEESENALALVPWVSVAACIEDGRVAATRGEVHCALPLAVETHLPVHVNSFFLLSTDGSGLAAGENAPGRWNRSLLHHDVPGAYCLLLEGVRTLLLQQPMTYAMAEPLYAVLPCAAHPQTVWWDLQCSVLAKITSDTTFLWTGAGKSGGRWIDLRSAVILKLPSSPDLIPELMKEILLHQEENYVTVMCAESDPLNKVLEAAGRQDCITSFKQFFADKFLARLDQLPCPEADAWLQQLLGYALAQCGGDGWLVPLMSETKCLRSRSGHLCLPRDLIDPQPNDIHLRSLFSQCPDLLPTDALNGFLPLYRSCGLVSSAEQLSESMLLQQARQTSKGSTAKRQAIDLCNVLEAKLQSMTPSEEFIGELRKIPFLPVLQKPTEWYLRWQATEDGVCQACLDEILPHSLHSTVGSVAVFVDNRDLLADCPKLIGLFGIVEGKQPSHRLICEQMRVLIAAAAGLPASSRWQQKERSQAANISLCVRSLYECMQQQVVSGVLDAAQYSQMPCIWSPEHAAFVAQRRAALSAPDGYGDLMPHRLAVDSEHSENFENLFVALGVRERLESDDVHAVLQDIHGSHTDDESGVRRQLSASDTELVIRLVKILHSDSDFEPEGFLLPTKTGLMLPARECIFVDRLDLLADIDDDDEETGELLQLAVHAELKEIAKELGAVPLSARLLPSDNLVIEIAGPYQELTSRLSNILDDYPDDDTILKELIQNADDAGATRVSFVMDWRDHRGDGESAKGLLNDKMREWQGPAVLAFNDSTFSSADFANIMKLGGATKKDELGKIGRFGLGFSSVYHLTDVPSFVSGNYIVICDPHTKYLGGRVTKAQPGVKIDFVKSRKGLKKFSKQFEPYRGIFGCNMEDPYNATLFRLPLRSARSDICKNVLSDEHIVGLFEKCWSSLPHILLFLQSVREVSVYEIPKEASEPVLLFKAVSSTDTSDGEEGVMARQGLRQLHATHGGGLHDFIDKLPVAESQCYQATVEITTEMSAAGRGRFADVIQPESQTWILSAGLGVEEAKHLALRKTDVDEKLVPWGGCAVKLNDNRLPAAVSGRAFSFLPLPIDTQLPFHFNGCLSVSSNRRHLELSVDGGLKTCWNEAVLTDVIPRTYLSLLQSSTPLCRDAAGREALNSLFPTPAAQGPARPVVAGLYSSLLSGDEFAVFWSSAADAWLTGQQSLFLMDVEMFQDYYQDAVTLLSHVNEPIVEQPPNAVREVLANPELLSGQEWNSADLCMSFREFFETELVAYCADSDAMDMDLYCKLLMCLLNYYNRTPTPDADWCLELLKSTLKTPTSQGSLKLASELVDRNTPILAAMYSDSDGYFPEKTFLEGRYLDILLAAGLIHETLPAEYVQERALSVSSLPQPSHRDQAVQRCAAVLRYVSDKSTSELGDAAEYLRSCPFLPVSQHVDGYVFECAGNGHSTMAAARELYVERHVHIVGSQALLLDEHALLEREGFDLSRVEAILELGRKEPPLDSVIAQFQHVVAVTNDMASSADSEQHMQTTVLQLYSELSARKPVDLATLLPESIWVKSRRNCRFVSPKIVVAPSSRSTGHAWYGSLEPYCYVLSDALYKFKDLLQVQQSLKQDALIDVLHRIRKEIGNGRLTDPQLQVCKSLLQHVAGPAQGLDSILLPTEDRLLRPARECSYIDCDFELATELAVTHNVADLAPRVACKLGAQPLTRRLLKLPAFSYKKSGQAEPLTTRLKNNLEGYPKGVSVLKELIQNADDAGASRVCFLLDTREHAGKTLFGPEMKAWQGPALLCFNDARFSDDDFDSILRLGGATKRGKEEQIGQFGLGFSSVYNITDVPSFVSGQRLVILDPHVHNLGENLIDNANPGVTVDFVTGEGVQNFRDQLAPYHNVMGCKVLDTPLDFDSTLFRFPLRSKQAAKSKISDFYPDARDMQRILLELRDTADNYLLFLQSVTELSVYVHDSTRSSDEEQFAHVFSCQVTESAPAVTGQLEGARRDAMRQWATERKKSGSAEYSKCAAHCLLTMETKRRSRWPGTAPHGDWRPVTTSQWLVCSGTGRGSAIQLAESSEHKSKCPVPWAGVAVRVDPATRALQPVTSTEKLTGKPRGKPTGKVFCFLPLPQSQDFPVHINGFFAVTSDRRDVKFTDDGRDFETEWNACLLRDPIATCYLSALHCWTQWFPGEGRSGPELLTSDTLVKYMPSPAAECSAAWRSLPEAFLELLLEPDAPALFWLPTNGGGEWLNACAVRWVDGPQFGEHAQQAVAMLQGLGQPALLLPDMYQHPSRKEFRPINFESFFLEYFFAHGEEISDEDHSMFMGLLLDFSIAPRGSSEAWWKNPLQSEKCIRSSCDAMVRCSQVVSRGSPLAKLYTEEDGKFAKACYMLTENHLHALCKFAGMISDRLPNAELLDRARSVRRLADMAAGSQRADLLLELLSRDAYYEQICGESDAQRQLQQIEFLPVLLKPEGYLLSWCGDSVKERFVSAPRSLPAHHQDLAGSVMALVDLRHGPRLCNLLGYEEPPLDTVLQQLDSMLEQRTELKEDVEDDSVPLQPRRDVSEVTDPSFLQRVSCAIYEYLNGQLADGSETDATSADNQERKARIVEFLNSKAWVWFEVTGRFVSVETITRVTTGSKFSCPPFFNVVNSGTRLFEFSQLWQAVDVTEDYRAEYILRVMSVLYRAYSGASPCRQVTDDHLSGPYPLVTTGLLRDLAQELVRRTPDCESLKKVVLPDKNGFLRYVEDLSFDSTPWMSAEEYGSAVILASSKVPWELADGLGMERSSDRLVKSDDLGDDIEEDFGQEEALSDRIKNILRTYSPDVSILKELIQNADDARAEVIHFVLDTRTGHPDEKLLHTGLGDAAWKGLQHCPALCVFNDRPFTERDIAGISKLGCGSKRGDTETTGRFGIGFNAVYHLTDCPSFLSRGPGGVAQDLCVFDPHRRYVPKARGATKPGKPGRRYRLSQDTEEQFCDQFEPYLGSQLSDVKTATDGSTVFRLPLRSGAEEGLSQAWSTKQVQELLEKLSESGTELLLFLNSLSTIRVSVLGDDGQLAELLHVSCDAANRRSNSMPKMLLVELTSTDQQYHCYQQETVLRATGKKEIREKWLMVRCTGVDRESAAATQGEDCRSRNKAIEEGHEHGLVPRADVAARLSMPRRQQAAPGSVASGLLFTTLPTPIRSGLPVHINGHFLLNEARTKLDNVTTGAEVIRTWWNDWLLRCVAMPAYHHLLDKASHLVTSCCGDGLDGDRGECAGSRPAAGGGCVDDSPVRPPLAPRAAQAPGCVTSGTLDWYYALFPCSADALELGGGMWRDFCADVYSKIVRSGTKVLASHTADPRYWQPWRPCAGTGAGVFHDFHEHLSRERVSVCDLFHLLIGLSVPLTQAPMAILDEIRKGDGGGGGGGGTLQTPAYLRDFLLAIAGPLVRAQSLGTGSADVRNVGMLLKYCMEGVARGGFDSAGEGLPLLLTESGELQVFSRTVPAFMTSFPALIADRLDRAVSVKLLESSKVKVLSKLASDGGCQCLANLPLCEIVTSVRSLHPALLCSKVARKEEGAVHQWMVSLWRHILSNPQTCQLNNLCRELNAVSFIPVSCSERGHVLVSPEQAWRIIACSCDSRRPLHRGLHKLGMYMPAFASVRELLSEEVKRSREVISPAGTRSDDCGALSKSLARLQFSEECVLTDAEASTLRDQFVAWSRQRPGLTSEQLELLRRLPIYPSVDNTSVSLGGVQEFFQMPVHMPKDGCGVWARSLELLIQVLRPLGEHLRTFLTGHLAICELSLAEVYTKVIVPKLMKMTHEQRLPHLRYIQDAILSGPASDSGNCKDLVNALRQIPFVTASDNRPRRADELFGRTSVFEIFVKPAFFPNDFWLGTEWNRLLKRLGFTGTVKKAVFLQFAGSIEAAWDSRQHHDLLTHLREFTKVESRKASSALVVEFARLVLKSRTIFMQSMGKDQPAGKKIIDEEAFLKAAGKVRFSFPMHREQLGRLLPHSAQLCRGVDTSGPVSLCQAVSHDWYSLVWTTIPVCSHELQLSDNGEEGFLGRSVPKLLGMKSEPSLQDVLRHVNILLEALTDKSCALDSQADGHSADRKQLMGIFDEIYKYLDAKCADGEFLARIRTSLDASPCILADQGQILLPPKQVLQNTFSDRIQMEPYLAQLPKSYVDRFPVLMLKCFRIPANLTPQQCALVLRLIKHAHPSKEYEFHEVNTPNEHQLICKCFAELASQLSDNAAAAGGSSDLGDLFLPCCTAKQLDADDRSSIVLVMAQDAVAMDKISLFRRLHNFYQLDYLLPLEDQRSASVATELGARLLSRVVSEVVEDTIIESLENCLWESEPAATTSATATSHKDGEDHLISALVRLLRSEEFAQGVRRILVHGKTDPKSCDEKLQVLRNARFALVQVLDTVLKYDGEIIAGSQEEQPCHASDKRQPHLTLFIRKEESKCARVVNKFQTRLADEICSIIGLRMDGRIQTLRYIRALLVSDPNEVRKTLDEEGVTRIFNIQHAISNVTGDCLPPPLGKDITLESGLFDPGENPAELHFGIHQIVVCLVRQEKAYVLARIKAETTLPGCSGHMRRFLVEIAPDTYEDVSVLDLFRFQTEIINRYVKENGGQELEIFTGNSSGGGASTGAEDHAVDLATAKEKIRKELRALFDISDEDVRRKLLKRMQLQWHPDKHPGLELVYTEAFKYLMNLYEHVSKGGSMADFDGESNGTGSGGHRDWAEEFASTFRRHYPWWYRSRRSGGSSSSHRRSHWSSGGSNGGGDDGGGGGGGQWRGRRRHWGRSDFNAFFHASPSPRGCQSQYEGRRWLLQAESDLAVVREQVTHHCGQPGSNALACFMAQQAVEKALKAALYVTVRGLTEADRSSHDVDRLAQLLAEAEGCEHLGQHVGTVSQYYNSTRYPYAAAGFQCPFENFSSDTAQEALVTAELIVETVGNFVRPTP